jgi:phospholipid/cholesterol/gamma-HCH transport system substrate-binding protein
MTKLNEFIVGIVFIFAMSVLGYFTIVRGDLFDEREYYTATVIFDDVEGLTIGNKVLINGVEAGTVTSIELMADSKVIVSLRMYRFFVMYENYKIVLKNQSALGGRIITINPGNAEADGKLFEVVKTVMNLHGRTLGDPLAKITEVIDENRDNIKIALSNIREFSEKINKGEGTIAKLVNKDTLHEETGKLLKELRDTIEDSREQAPVTSFIRAALTAF